MGLLDFLWGWFGWGRSAAKPRREATANPARPQPQSQVPRRRRWRQKGQHVRLQPLKYRRLQRRQQRNAPVPVKTLPYRFAQLSLFGGFLDLSTDLNSAKLMQSGLPVFGTPEELANWLGLPVGKVAWLIHRCRNSRRAASLREAHYHYRWKQKRKGGWRLIEAPKTLLKQIQQKILQEILHKVPVHPACHGFVPDRSIRTNALPHVGQRVILKLDLQNFYTTISFSRVVAIFRSLGYSREAAIWLGGLTTTALPERYAFAEKLDLRTMLPYARRHLPQGAPTSPALANLSAFSLDLRLAGLSRRFEVHYTRYADDLTFSGPGRLLASLRKFFPLVRKIIKQERFVLNAGKKKVVRNHQRQVVTGVVVNERVNISRQEYDRLKAILTNCLRHGPSTQNHEHRENWAAHLLGRIGHISHLNPARGEKLLALYQQIDWQS